MEGERVDLAIIGAGVAGAWVADAMLERRPDWSIALFERSDRIGGRLRSQHVADLAHPIELGGMRFLTSHRRVTAVVTAFNLPTRPFDATGGGERTFLRGRFANGAADPDAGAGYDLADDERGRSAVALNLEAFEQIIPNAASLGADAYRDLRATGTYRGRRLTDWAIGEAVGTIRSREGHRFVVDAFGYDSGMRVFNAGDVIEFLLGGGDPTAEARTPSDGMDRIPASLAERFAARGGRIGVEHDLLAIELDAGEQRLRFSNGATVNATRTVLATPVPALQLLAAGSAALTGAIYRRLFDAVEAFPAAKLYLWYERPWWRPAVPGIRMTTDLPPRKVFYFDEDDRGPAAMLATYTDGVDVGPWRELWNGAPGGSAAPPRMVAAAQGYLRTLHPDAAEIPEPAGSSFVLWGADPHEIGWTFWRAGAVSDEVMAAAVQPDPAIGIYLAGEAFSRSQSWVEGALESAELVVRRLVEE
jgi:monoamine oxidase